MSDINTPKWLEAILNKQKEDIISALSKNPNPPKKRKHDQEEENEIIEEEEEVEEEDIEEKEDSEDEFDRKYGHLIGPSSEATKTKAHPSSTDPNDSEASVDEDLIDISDHVPNWDTSSSLKKFIKANIDRPLSEEILKQINEDFTPEEAVTDFFKPPDMPSKLLRPMKKLQSKGAISTERALFNAQKQLFTASKPLVSALTELKPLGDSVKKARELLSISLRGIYSVSLKMSHARRENARFLIKNSSLAETLYSYPPTHDQLFGGNNFSSQLEKAVKESKIDLSWNKPKKTFPHSQNYQGFLQYSKGAGKYFRKPNYNNNNNIKYNNNYSNNSNNNRRKANTYPQKGSNKGRSAASQTN